MKTLFRWLNKFLLGWTVLLYFLPRVRWEEKRSMPKGPVLLVSNHKNHMDFLLLMAVFYFRYLRCLVGKTFYESSGAMHFLLRMLGAIKVDRFSFDMDFFYECMDALQKRQTLLIPGRKILRGRNDVRIPRYRGAAGAAGGRTGRARVPRL